MAKKGVHGSDIEPKTKNLWANTKAMSIKMLKQSGELTGTKSGQKHLLNALNVNVKVNVRFLTTLKKKKNK